MSVILYYVFVCLEQFLLVGRIVSTVLLFTVTLNSLSTNISFVWFALLVFITTPC